VLQNAQSGGRFIVFDGPDGAGKTTVVRHVAGQLRGHGFTVTLCKDPGGTVVGDRVRSVLLDHDLTGMAPACETLLFMASRAQLVAEVVRPALARGEIVLCDRFVSATCAYQVAAGYDFDAIVALAHYAIGATWPDLTLILDVPCALGFARVRQRSLATDGPGAAPALDSMEARPRAFHEAVRAHFLALPQRYPAPVAIVDAGPVVEEVADAVLRRIQASSANQERVPARLPRTRARAAAVLRPRS
jgi:dTMP kinase